MKLVFPGKFGSLAGNDFDNLPRPLEVRTLSDLLGWLITVRPTLGEAVKASRAKAIVNHEVIHDLLHVIADDDEIAFLPPMSGG